MHRIYILAQSKKLAGAIFAVRSLLHLRSKHCKNVAWYTALFHSTWGWDSSWGLWGAREILHLARGRQNDGVQLEYHCRVSYEQPRKFVPNYLMTSLVDVECWERPLRYHHCRVHDLLRGFRKFTLLSLKSTQIPYLIYDGSFRDMILPSNRPK